MCQLIMSPIVAWLVNYYKAFFSYWSMLKVCVIVATPMQAIPYTDMPQDFTQRGGRQYKDEF